MLEIPQTARQLARICLEAGGRAWLVGGCARDALRGEPARDLDVEVHGLDEDALAAVLEALGGTRAVGRAYSVHKLHSEQGVIDVSATQQDARDAWPDDPTAALRLAARRRDLTINAIAIDPLTGEVADPFNGRADLAAGVLRQVDDETFAEDPARVLRVAHIAGRFGFTPTPGLIALCQRVDVSGLPAERVGIELDKLLLRSPRPSIGLRVARRTGALAALLPDVADHPADELDAALDRAATRRAEAGGPPRPLALMLAALLHPLDDDGVARALDQLDVFSRGGFPLRATVRAAVRHWRALAVPVDDAALRAAAEVSEVMLTALTAWAASGAPCALEACARSRALGVSHTPLPPLLLGRDLLSLGVPAGPHVGEILAAVRKAQIQGTVSSQEQALAWARSLLPTTSPEPECA